MTQTHSTPKVREWRKARRSAFVQDVLASFTQRPANLMSFGHVQQKLQLSDLRYLGLQEVPLDQIVGSVGRYTEFNRFFFPRQDNLQERWQRIEQLRAAGRNLPPIELYKVGQAYFVRDGHHRVSVARQHGTFALEAMVWEYETNVPLEPESDVDDLLCKMAHAAFVERTNVEHDHPGLQIKLTQPKGYEDLLCEIEAHREIFSRIEQRELSNDEALALWYDIRYSPLIEIMRQFHILQHFPGLTEADLYLWLCCNQQELEGSYGHHILLEEAARDLIRNFGKDPLLTRRISQAVRWWTSVALAWALDRWKAFRAAWRRKSG